MARERRRKRQAEARRKGQTVSKTRPHLADWTILVTNVPGDRLTLDAALTVMRACWQVGLRSKLWKQHGRVDDWRSGRRWRIRCEIYAELLALVVQHWVLLTGSWTKADRGLVKAAPTVRAYGALLASAFNGVLSLETALRHLSKVIAMGCRMNTRKTRPNTYQLLVRCGEAA